jgi:hypothetical protein
MRLKNIDLYTYQLSQLNKEIKELLIIHTINENSNMEY